MLPTPMYFNQNDINNKNENQHTMSKIASFFHLGSSHKNTNTEEPKVPHRSVRDLQARAYNTWVSQGVADRDEEIRSHNGSSAGSFEQARAARRASRDADEIVVMKY